MKPLDSHISTALDWYSQVLEQTFESDVLCYFGPIYPQYVTVFIEHIEKLKSNNQESPTSGKVPNKNRLCLLLTTPGGSAEAVEKMVEVVRHHYDEFHIYVPQYAMSAGTIFAMAADKIFMDYSSSLGPIDPQVPLPDGRWIPALGYLDKVNEFIEKSRNNTLTNAEFLWLQNQDLGLLRSFEQAKDLSIALLKKWLVNYKFKDWTLHRTTRQGQVVTDPEKIARAEEIATRLSDNNTWHSHGRMIGIKTLRSELRLQIEDYTANEDVRQKLRVYTELLVEFAAIKSSSFMIHSWRAKL